ncbi:MAG: hypothetical protein WA988_17765 [Candidatus Nanopelagicales bacterium]
MSFAVAVPWGAAMAAGVVGVVSAVLKFQGQLRTTVDWVASWKERRAVAKAESGAAVAWAKLDEASAERQLAALQQAADMALGSLPAAEEPRPRASVRNGRPIQGVPRSGSGSGYLSGAV